MMYSSGIFNENEYIEKVSLPQNSYFKIDPKLKSDTVFETILEKSQEEKVNQLINKLNVSQDSHVLEIGSGWGYVAIKIAKKFGCKVTTLTLSKEQFKFTSNRIKSEGLEKFSINKIIRLS